MTVVIVFGVFFALDKILPGSFTAGIIGGMLPISCSFLISQGYFLPNVKTSNSNYFNPLAETAGKTWSSCMLWETLWMLGFSVALFLIQRDRIVELLVFWIPALLVYVYVNMFSPFSLRRRKARWIFLAGTVVLLVLLCLLFSKYESETAPSPAAGIAGFSVVGAVLLAWLVSIPISYDKHVKVLQYPGEKA